MSSICDNCDRVQELEQEVEQLKVEVKKREEGKIVRFPCDSRPLRRLDLWIEHSKMNGIDGPTKVAAEGIAMTDHRRMELMGQPKLPLKGLQ